MSYASEVRNFYIISTSTLCQSGWNLGLKQKIPTPDHTVIFVCITATNTAFKMFFLYRKRRNKRPCFNKRPSPCAMKLTMHTNIPFKRPPTSRFIMGLM